MPPTNQIKYSYFWAQPRSPRYLDTGSAAGGPYKHSRGDVISLPLGSRFSGRHAGGATRDHIFGGSYYGSGYPYGSYGSTWVGGRLFPFFYWPIYIGPYEYYGASEYGPANSTDRPGGPMYTASILTIDSKFNTSDVYRILGDQDSINAILSALHEKCSVANGTVLGYSPSTRHSSRDLPHVESIVQFYRASSFALSLDGYINSAALPNNTKQLVSSLGSPTPLPIGIDQYGDLLVTSNDPTGAMIA
ncbi:unnamed protein product [Rhizoctonia solani]|uniref:Uncharacterized protein n=1 Tax=Rhizoctonia solani TaxID=456999 RepID=A0A8H3HHI4_9AGAM|nr:unnamed protein product [Rhizoctonia solani]